MPRPPKKSAARPMTMAEEPDGDEMGGDTDADGDGAAPAGPAPVMPPAAPGADPAAAPATAQDDPVAAALQGLTELPKVRPEVESRIQGHVDLWWQETDNQPQRTRAIAEVREAHKHLFPGRFDPTDPVRGQVMYEQRTGKDDRRVNVPKLFRDGIQMTAMTVPDDTTFEWSPAKQVKKPQDPMLGVAAQAAVMQGVPAQMAPAAVGAQPISNNPDPNSERFAESLGVVQENLLIETDWLQKIQAWVQDHGYYPVAAIKFFFRRDYRGAPIAEAPLNKDEQDNVSLLETLVQRFAAKDFDEKHADYSRMLQIMEGLRSKAEIERWFGVELQLIPMDALGICETGVDFVDRYQAPYIWHDALVTGEDLIAKFPYRVLPSGETVGLLTGELQSAQAFNPNVTETSRGRQKRTRNNALPAQGTPAPNQKPIDPLKQQYVYREIWCKKDRTVYGIVKGIKHFVTKFIPQRKSDRWYPFAILGTNRVPGEVYCASDLELKKDIQKRINRKRTDEEKSRWLSLPRGIFNTGNSDEVEIKKLADIQPGQIRGVNLGNAKIGDVIAWTSYQHPPEAFDTSKDERDADMMGAMPAQSLGATGIANYATEVNVAAQGSAIALQFRQGIVRREIEGMLVCIAQELLQELTPEEARQIGGPYTYWPEVYGDKEAKALVVEARDRIRSAAMPQLLPELVERMRMGAPLSKGEIVAKLDTLVAPMLAAEMQQRFGGPEPVTRESLFRRLKVTVKSVLSSSLDRQQRIQSLSMLAEATAQMSQAAQASGVPFQPREMLALGAQMIGNEANLDRMFPPAPPVPLGQPPIGAPAAPGGTKERPENQGAMGGPPNEQQNIQNANTPPMAAPTA